jgi:hypothetical protein
MKRFRRWVFNGFSAISLLLCVASIALWIWSEYRSPYSPFPRNSFQRGAEVYGYGIEPGVIQLSREGPTPFLAEPFVDDGLVGWDQTINILGVQVNWFSYPHIGPVKSRWVLLVEPFWWITFVTSGLPALWTIQNIRRHRKRSNGFCTKCGYDLRATPARCPECGTVPSKPVISK